MFDDEESSTYPERDQHIFDEKVDKEGGVFIEPQHSQRDCNTPGNECGPDEYPEDPYAIDNRTGTGDDMTYSFGVELPNPDDQHLVPEGHYRRGHRGPATDYEVETELGDKDENDLWGRQQELIEEDVNDGVKMPVGMNDEDAEKVLDMMGAEFSEEDQAETSATGEPTTGPDHGGFDDEG